MLIPNWVYISIEWSPMMAWGYFRFFGH